MARIVVGFGSNLGDRAARILGGLAGCARHGLRLTDFSRVYESAPEGGPAGQGNYLNAVGVFESGLDAAVLLRILQIVEADEGRVRGERNAPRTLDLDLLLAGEERRDDPNLTLPHPRLMERLFVLFPLADVLADARIPGANCTVAQALEARVAATPNLDSRIWLHDPT